LALPGMPPANVVIQKVPGDRLQDLPAERYPCILICPYGAETLDPRAGTNNRDDVVYPVMVAILASERDAARQPTSQQEKRFDQYLRWRESIRKSFHNQRLTSTLCHTVEVQALEIVDRSVWFERGIFVSRLLLRCVSRESRG
jgi:hypothetical protein